MAADAGNGVGWMSVPVAGRAGLYALRAWSQLSLATDEGVVWVKGFLEEELERGEVKCIPYASRYVERGGFLHLPGHLVPLRPVPPLLWTPIARALPVELPAENHGYFGMAESTVEIQLITSAREEKTIAMQCDLADLVSYVEGAPAARLERLRWALLGSRAALLLGTPMLPIPGIALWQRGAHLLPAGMDFEHSFLADALVRKLTSSATDLLLWTEKSAWTVVPESGTVALSRSSVRLTLRRVGLQTA